MDQSFSFTIDTSQPQSTVYLSGTIDAEAATEFHILEKRIHGTAVILDFSKVGRINSMGIALILRCLKHLTTTKQTTVMVRGTNQINSMLFKMSGIYLLAREAP